MLARIMNWNLLASTLLGALITYSAILLTQAIELWKRDRAQKKLIQALLQALREEGLFYRISHKHRPGDAN